MSNLKKSVILARSKLRYFLRYGILPKGEDPSNLWPTVCTEDRSIWVAQGGVYRACIDKKTVTARKDSVSVDIYERFAKRHNRELLLVPILTTCHSHNENYHAPNWEAYPEREVKNPNHVTATVIRPPTTPPILREPLDYMDAINTELNDIRGELAEAYGVQYAQPPVADMETSMAIATPVIQPANSEIFSSELEFVRAAPYPSLPVTDEAVHTDGDITIQDGEIVMLTPDGWQRVTNYGQLTGISSN